MVAALLIAVPFASSASLLNPSSNGPSASSSGAGLVGTCVVTGAGNAPFPAYDPVSHAVYVPTLASLVVLNTCAVGKVPFPTTDAPTGAAFDPQNNEVYVTDLTQNQVYVTQGMTPVATITSASFNAPESIAFDPAADLMVVGNALANNVAFRSGVTVIGTTTVGHGPVAIDYDPFAARILVTNSGSDNVASLDAAHPMGTPHTDIPVGRSPNGWRSTSPTISTTSQTLLGTTSR